MSSILNNYGAMTTKIKAMYGRRLRYEDFAAMSAMTSVPAVLDYLRRTAWAPTIARLDQLPRNRANLEAMLQEQTRTEYVRLLNFVPRGDKELLAFPVRLAELHGILIALRRLKAGQILNVLPLPDRFLIHSRMDYHLLSTCTEFSGIVTAAANTIYAHALRQLQPEHPGALPENLLTHMLLYTVYFSQMYRSINRDYGGEVRSVLLKSLGQQIDLLNIIHILRLKAYFPQEQTCLPYLFPFHYRMKPAQLQELAGCATVQDAFDWLQSSPYASAFRDVADGGISQVERFYRTAMYQFHRHQVICGLPSISTAVSYLHLKDAEMSALINVIESVNYGVPCDDSFTRLVGS